MTATQAPTPGPLSGDNVKLLVKGDLLRVNLAPHLIGADQKIEFGTVVSVEDASHGVIGVRGDHWGPEAFTFIGRPDESGWMPWSGGENPVPGRMVDFEDGTVSLVNCLSDTFDVWDKPGCFRLAPTAPVEASGLERERLISVMRDHIELGEIGSCSAEIVGHEEAADAILALRPQPSGETREAACEMLAQEYERADVGEGPYPSYAELARKGEGSFTMCSVRAVEKALLSARPLALGGQQGEVPADIIAACKRLKEAARSHRCENGSTLAGSDMLAVTSYVLNGPKS